MSRYSPLIRFGLSWIGKKVLPPATWHVMIIDEVVPERPAPRFGVDVVIGDPVITTISNIHYDYTLVTRDTLVALVCL